MTDISIFNGINPNPKGIINITTIVDNIKTSNKTLIDAIRKAPDDEKNKLKCKLPSVTFAGTFNYRNYKGLKSFSGLACIDLDKIDKNFDQIIKKVKADEHTMACFVSPSGKGIKIIIKVPDKEKYKDYILGYYDYLNKSLDINAEYLDKNTNDTTRLCFLSYDPDIYYNTNNKVWSKKLEYEVKPNNNKSASEYNVVKHLILGGIRSFESINDYMVSIQSTKWLEKPLSYHKLTYKKVCLELGLDLTGSKKLEVFKCGDLIESDLPPINWIVPNMVLENGTHIWAGSPSVGKSWLGLELALSHVSDKLFIDKYECTQGTVLYIDEENGKITMRERLLRLMKGNNIDISCLNNIYLSDFNDIKLDNEGGKDALIKLIEECKPSLVIVDSAVRCISGEENKSDDVKKIFSNIKSFMKEHDKMSFVLLHHTTKDTNQNMNSIRGSGDFSAQVDCAMVFKKTEGKNYAVGKMVKSRHTNNEELDNFGFEIADVEHFEGSDKKSIKIQYKFEMKSKKELCIKEVAKYLYNTGRNEIKKQYIEEHVNYGGTAVKNAMNELKENGCLLPGSKSYFYIVDKKKIKELYDIIDYSEVENFVEED